MTDLSTSPVMMDPRLQATPGVKQMPRNAAGIAKVAEDFEAFFAGLVFDQISSDVEPDPVTGGGEGEDMFKGLLNQEYGKAIARTHSLGIADIVQKQLLQIQEVA
ncbi:rod-binding protein [Dongia rigui]|uniref:Rod-binding protein n=1 Tax=Dongia rigui TaxID=940149 RepID=A0ABU5DT63_9PROT|nr:rod-binding protein [Dongia rigui]MDY0870539.1 rod-binding protein [Dongia rigui]